MRENVSTPFSTCFVVQDLIGLKDFHFLEKRMTREEIEAIIEGKRPDCSWLYLFLFAVFVFFFFPVLNNHLDRMEQLRKAAGIQWDKSRLPDCPPWSWFEFTKNR